ncbi:MAG: hypothetical protein LBG19_06705 [Prevotellaceae bacterium]|jgi:hypothetical protein|nr:hypothetical protein [Prevotellaceae bacterium]
MNEGNDKLKDLFKELKIEEPSIGFTSRLIHKVDTIIEAKDKKRKALNKILIGICILGGLTGIFGLTWFLFGYYGIEVNTPQISWPVIEVDMPTLKFPSFIVMLAIVVLLLLSVDLFIRKRHYSKKQKV